MGTLPIILMLLGASVVSVILFRRLNLPPILGYLLVGTLIGPHAFDMLDGTSDASHLAEFGVVFLMFSIGLEFSLSKLVAMKRIVFGLGLLQVTLTLAVVTGVIFVLGMSWQAGVAIGGALAMSSTAVLIKLLAERMELDARTRARSDRCAAVSGSGGYPAADPDPVVLTVARNRWR